MANRDGREDDRCVGHHQRVHLGMVKVVVTMTAQCYDDTKKAH